MNAVTASRSLGGIPAVRNYRAVYVALWPAAHLHATRRTEMRHSLAASCCDHPRTNRR